LAGYAKNANPPYIDFEALTGVAHPRRDRVDAAQQGIEPDELPGFAERGIAVALQPGVACSL